MKKNELLKTKDNSLRQMKSHGGDKVFGLEMWQIRGLVPVLAVILLVLISYGFVFAPKLVQIKDFIKKNKAVEEKIIDVNQKRAYIQSIDDSQLNAMQETLLMALPESKDIYFLLNVINDLVSDYGFMVDSFSISPGELKEDTDVVSEGLSKFNFQVSLVGPSARYLELVDGLEASLPILTLDSLESKSVSSDFMTIDLSLTTYFASSKTKIDVNKLTYKDLLMSQEEIDVLERLGSFRKIGGLFLNKESLDSGKQFEEYEIRNPFSVD